LPELYFLGVYTECQIFFEGVSKIQKRMV